MYIRPFRIQHSEVAGKKKAIEQGWSIFLESWPVLLSRCGEGSFLLLGSVLRSS